MKAGKLDREIVIEVLGSGNDEYGEESGSWSTFATVWANVQEAFGGESFPNKERIAEQKATFKIRFLSGMDPKMRIIYNSLTYDIMSIAELSRGEGHLIEASAQIR